MFTFIQHQRCKLSDWLQSRWDAGRREMDVTVLWPYICQQTDDIDEAKAAFAFHIMHDPAWTREFSEMELIYFVDRLEAPKRSVTW